MNVVALRRLVISRRRGWDQFPGLSATGAGVMGRWGVRADTTLVPEADMALPGVEGCCLFERLFGMGGTGS